MEQNEKTRALLIEHYNAYPKLKTEDFFKYIFQSAFGCEHMMPGESAALDYLKREYESVCKTEPPRAEALDGEYARVHLSCLNAGLKPETLARLFCLSARKEPNGKALLEEKIKALEALVCEGTLPLERESFYESLRAWRAQGCAAIHHSEAFRAEYRPAYRVIAKKYADFLPVFTAIDKLAEKKNVIIALEGGSASGKTTLAGMLAEIYGCAVFHMDDFFLRPEQRTPERFAEIGGNVDRERFAEEVLAALKQNEAVRFRRFDCGTQTLGEAQTVAPERVTVVEGVYSMHPAFSRYYDLAVFLDIDAARQRKRILLRNSGGLAERFFGEWIPLENKYFSDMGIKERADLVIESGE